MEGLSPLELGRLKREVLGRVLAAGYTCFCGSLTSRAVVLPTFPALSRGAVNSSTSPDHLIATTKGRAGAREQSGPGRISAEMSKTSCCLPALPRRLTLSLPYLLAASLLLAATGASAFEWKTCAEGLMAVTDVVLTPEPIAPGQTASFTISADAGASGPLPAPPRR